MAQRCATNTPVNEGINQKHISSSQTHSCPALQPFCIPQRHVTPRDTPSPFVPHVHTRIHIHNSYIHIHINIYIHMRKKISHVNTHQSTQLHPHPNTHTHTQSHMTTHVTETDLRVRHYSPNPSTSPPHSSSLESVGHSLMQIVGFCFRSIWSIGG